MKEKPRAEIQGETAESKVRAGVADRLPAPKRRMIFFLSLLLLIAFAVFRSSLATRLDSFTYDEAFHIAAGAAHFQTGDFRLNPEQPPLIKLWVGAFVTPQIRISPFPALRDKNEEREFLETEVYLNNDPDALQRRARIAMFTLNGLLLFWFGVAARRIFGGIPALGATAFLAIDPTVAAHLPVVMTDLPVALLSATAVLLSLQAFRSWRTLDLIFAAAALGLALSTKHSAVVTMLAVAVIGVGLAVFRGRGVPATARLRRSASVAAILLGAGVVLWSFYLFRFSESPSTHEEQFNRSLAEKISDVKSPVYRAGLTTMANARLFPRAYVWGMADTIRAGAEGRAISILAFGNLYYSSAPFYYFPGIIAVKLPLGLLFLALLGAAFLLVGRIPREWLVPSAGLIFLAVLFLLTLMKGSSYAGVRHALPVIPPLALLAGLAIYKALEMRSYFWRAAVTLALVAASLSAIPVMRPWEYFNETVGGASGAHRYFNDEGVDLSLRTKEIVEYYDQHLQPAGEIPFVIYLSPQLEWRRRGLDWVGKDPQRDGMRLADDTLTGTFIIGAKELAPTIWWDLGKDLRGAEPVARFGNVFVFRGTLQTPDAARAYGLYMQAIRGKIYVDEPDLEGGIEMLSQAVALDPKAFFVALELGNQYLKIGSREEALRAYRTALEYAPPADAISGLLRLQIERLESEPLERIAPLRNPAFE